MTVALGEATIRKQDIMNRMSPWRLVPLRVPCGISRPPSAAWSLPHLSHSGLGLQAAPDRGAPGSCSTSSFGVS